MDNTRPQQEGNDLANRQLSVTITVALRQQDDTLLCRGANEFATSEHQLR